MTPQTFHVKRWQWDKTLSEAAIIRQMEMEGLDTQRWKNVSGTRHQTQKYEFDKVILVMRGSIMFRIPETGEEVALNPGDRLELPAGTPHEAIVGPMGVVCLEGHRKPLIDPGSTTF
jgi:quercetin dioxygenase-like cupin family protein